MSTPEQETGLSDLPIQNGKKSARAGKDPKTGRFVDGNEGGPGRPKGRFSLTTQIIRRLEENPKETAMIIEWLLKEKRDLVWRMIDPEPPKDLNLGVGMLPFTINIVKDDGTNTTGEDGKVL